MVSECVIVKVTGNLLLSSVCVRGRRGIERATFRLPTCGVISTIL